MKAKIAIAKKVEQLSVEAVVKLNQKDMSLAINKWVPSLNALLEEKEGFKKGSRGYQLAIKEVASYLKECNVLLEEAFVIEHELVQNLYEFDSLQAMHDALYSPFFANNIHNINPTNLDDLIKFKEIHLKDKGVFTYQKAYLDIETDAFVFFFASQEAEPLDFSNWTDREYKTLAQQLVDNMKSNLNVSI